MSIHESPESLYGLYGEDLEEFLAETTQQPEQSAVPPMVGGIALNQLTEDIINKRDFYAEYE